MWTSCNKTWFVRITASFNCGHHVTKKRQSGQSIFFNCGCRVTKYCLSCKITDFKCGHFVTKKSPIFRTLIQIQATLPVFRHFRTKKNFSLYIIGAHFTSCPHSPVLMSTFGYSMSTFGYSMSTFNYTMSTFDYTMSTHIAV